MSDFVYTVVGQWPFPIDMLRYDGSEPLHPADAEAVQALSQDHVSNSHQLHAIHNIALVKKNPPRHWSPHTERWKSFDWDVRSLDDDVESPIVSEPEPSRMTKLRWEITEAPYGKTGRAYLGDVTIGHIVERKSDEHVWQIDGVYMKWIAKGYGESKTFEAAKRALTRAWEKWCEKAGLK